jgi:hypothetical protein
MPKLYQAFEIGSTNRIPCVVQKRPRLDARFGDLESKFYQLQAVA